MGRPDEPAERVEVAAQQAARPCLDEHISDRGRLDRASEDRHLAGVRSELAEQG